MCRYSFISLFILILWFLASNSLINASSKTMKLVKVLPSMLSIPYLGTTSRVSSLRKWFGDLYIYYHDNPICKTEKKTQMYRTDFWTLWEKARVGCFERTACILSIMKQITSPGWMHETSAWAWCTGKTQRNRVER